MCATPTPAPEKVSGEFSYRMTYTSTCGENSWVTSGPVTVEVTDGIAEVVAGPEPTRVATVSRLLELIDEATQGDADRVNVDYGDLGQPMRVEIDWSTDATDDELCIDVARFRGSGLMGPR